MSTNPELDTTEDHTIQDFAAGFFVEPYPAIAVRCGTATHAGKVRSNNEDHFAVISRTRSQAIVATNVPLDNLPRTTDESFMFVVADGMGGAAAGELASRMVLEKAWELANQASSWIMRLRDMSAQQVRERVDAYAAELHGMLLDRGEADPRLSGMGTTWTSAYVVGWDALIAHVGDSRAYHFCQAELQQVTRDHTLAQAYLDRGAPVEQIAKMRHILTNSLGADEHRLFVDVGHVPLIDGDRLLLCTDGLSDHISDAEISAMLGRRDPPQPTCDALVALALDRGGRDNITVVLADFAFRSGNTSEK
jgi:protein phosphatase